MKKLLSILMCLCLIMSTLTFVSIPASAASYSGYCGTNVNWSLDTSTGILEITGTGDMKDYSSPSSVSWYSYRSYIKTVTIGNSVKSIGGSAFCNCDSLTSVTIPNSVTSIGDSAFCNCDSLEKVNITDLKSWCEIEFVGSYSNPLYYAKKLYLNGELLTNLAIPNSVTSIGNSAFSYCTSLTSVTIPNSVTSIGNSAFSYCTSLTSVTIPNSVTSIGDSAFYYCDSLTSVTIPNTVTNIGGSAFYYCKSLTSVTVDKNNKNYCSENGVLFNKDKTILIQYPAKSERINYIIPNGVENIEVCAFCNSLSLTSITIPKTVTSIGYKAFDGCRWLAYVYYDGNTVWWERISIGSGNNYLTTAFIEFNHVHSYTSNITSKPTCTEEGTQLNTCACGHSYQSSIYAFGHTVVTDKALVATCTKTGLTQGSHCSVCDEVVVKQNTTKALGHKAKWVTTKKATYFAKGTSSYKCSVCGKVLKTKSIAKLKLKTPSFKLTGAKGKFTVKYTKVTGATGFEIRYKLGKGKYKTVKVTTKKSMSKVIKKLKKGKYTVQIRAFIKQNKKTAYSKWSATKKVTVK